VNAVLDAETDRVCGANNRDGYCERSLATCVSTLTPRIPKLRSDSFFPEDVIERCQFVGCALVPAVVEMYAAGTSTRKAQGWPRRWAYRGSPWTRCAQSPRA